MDSLTRPTVLNICTAVHRGTRQLKVSSIYTLAFKIKRLWGGTSYRIQHLKPFRQPRPPFGSCLGCRTNRLVRDLSVHICGAA